MLSFFSPHRISAGSHESPKGVILFCLCDRDNDGREVHSVAYTLVNHRVLQDSGLVGLNGCGMDSRGSGPGKGSDVQTSPSSEDKSASNPMGTKRFFYGGEAVGV
jgi:hypothetical protein